MAVHLARTNAQSRGNRSHYRTGQAPVAVEGSRTTAQQTSVTGERSFIGPQQKAITLQPTMQSTLISWWGKGTGAETRWQRATILPHPEVEIPLSIALLLSVAAALAFCQLSSFFILVAATSILVLHKEDISDLVSTSLRVHLFILLSIHKPPTWFLTMSTSPTRAPWPSIWNLSRRERS